MNLPDRTGNIQEISILKQMFRVMKVTVFLLTVLFVNVSANSKAQHITIDQNRISLKRFFQEVRKQTGYHVLLESRNVSLSRSYDVRFQNTELEKALDVILSPTGLTYVMKDETIVVKEEEETEKNRTLRVTAMIQSRIAAGRVTDTAGTPLNGVSVTVKNTTNRTTTNQQGFFEIIIPEDAPRVLVFTFIGMQPQEVKEISENMRVTMRLSRETIEDVVVTGYSDIRKESFTGNAITITKEQILRTNPNNLIEGLQTFDPSFRIKENTVWGS